jgi:cyclic lactone autoinducer peptide
MDMNKTKAAQTIIKVAEKAAKDAVCKASPWNFYQTKESANVRAWAKKN